MPGRPVFPTPPSPAAQLDAVSPPWQLLLVIARFIIRYKPLHFLLTRCAAQLDAVPPPWQ